MKAHTNLFGHQADEHLAEHFTLGEMLFSKTALRLGIVNHLDHPEVIDRLRLLCQHVLEPLRVATSGPVRISSGYRSDCLNYVVGGSPASQHRLGEAADVKCRDESEARFYYDFIRLHLHYDQLLLEHSRSSGAWWVHVSYTERHPLRHDHRELSV